MFTKQSPLYERSTREELETLGNFPKEAYFQSLINADKKPIKDCWKAENRRQQWITVEQAEAFSSGTVYKIVEQLNVLPTTKS